MPTPDELTVELSQGLRCAPGTPFLRWVVHHLARALGCEWVIVWERVGAGWERLRVAAASHAGADIDDPLELDLAGTPCEQTLARGECVYPSDLQAAFPDLAVLKTLGANSFVGLRLTDEAGRSLGSLTVIDREPCSDPAARIAKLKLFEVRVSGELAARRAIHELEELVAVADGRHGHDVIEGLTRSLARALHVRAGFVCELLPQRPGHVRTSAIIVDGGSVAGGEANLEGTPCAVVYQQPTFLVADGFAQRFPDWPLLRLLPARAYLGLQIRARDGRLLGHVSVLHDQPLSERLAQLPIARLYADRIAAEIEWRDSDEKRRAAERELFEARKNEGLGVLAAGLAHDLNNRLTGVLGHVTMARTDIETTEHSSLARHLEAIERSTRSAAEVAQQMLACAGHCIRDPQPHDLSDLAQLAAQPLLASLPPTVRVELDLARSLPAVKGDGARLTQLVELLVRNAIEALPASGGRLRLATGRIAIDGAARQALRATADLEDGEHLFVEVGDDGCGIDEKALGRIFEPFFSTKEPGRGLGLAVAHGIARGHRGALTVRSAPGRGSRFRLLLPTAAVDGAPTPSVVPAPPAKAAGQGALRGVVLLVEDEPMVRAATTRMLERIGFTAHPVAGGAEALRALNDLGDTVSLVLLDLTMPRMSGEEVFRSMRRLRPKLRVVLMTGYSAGDALERFQGAGLAGFLQKPFGLLELERCLRQSLLAVETKSTTP